MVLLQPEDKKAIGMELEGLKEAVKLVVHLPANKNEPNEDLKSLVVELSEMDERISCEVLMEGEDEEVDYILERRPALVIIDKDGSDRGVIFYGVPVGSTLKSIISLILLASTGETGLEEGVMERIMKMDPGSLQVLITPATPGCNKAMDIANRIAYINKAITSSTIDLTEFPEIAQQYHVLGLPMTIGSDGLKFTGAYDVGEVLQILEDKLSDAE